MGWDKMGRDKCLTLLMQNTCNEPEVVAFPSGGVRSGCTAVSSPHCLGWMELGAARKKDEPLADGCYLVIPEVL